MKQSTSAFLWLPDPLLADQADQAPASECYVILLQLASLALAASRFFKQSELEGRGSSDEAVCISIHFFHHPYLGKLFFGGSRYPQIISQNHFPLFLCVCGTTVSSVARWLAEHFSLCPRCLVWWGGRLWTFVEGAHSIDATQHIVQAPLDCPGLDTILKAHRCDRFQLGPVARQKV